MKEGIGCLERILRCLTKLGQAINAPYLVLFWCNSPIKAYGKGTIVVPTTLMQLDLPTRVRHHFAFSQRFQNRACNGERDGWSLLSDGYLPFTHEFLLVLALALCLTCLESHQRWNTMTAFPQAAGLGLCVTLGCWPIISNGFSSHCWKGLLLISLGHIDVGWAKYFSRLLGVFLEHGAIFSSLSC
ncbi:unnamed protein product [Prunus armeniaca]